MGCGLYITKDCDTLIERMENYLWEQFKSGPRIGQFTGKPEALGDDVVDSACYSIFCRISWMDPEEYIHSPAHSEADVLQR